MGKLRNTFNTLVGLACVIFFVMVVFGLHSSRKTVPRPRPLDERPKMYVVQNNAPKDIVYIAFHTDTSGDVFYAKEFGLDLYVQNGDKGFKQTVDSCKEMAPMDTDETAKDENVGESIGCDKKTYTVRLEKDVVVFYRLKKGAEKEIVTSIHVSPFAKRLVFVDSYKLYSKEAMGSLSILQNL